MMTGRKTSLFYFILIFTVFFSPLFIGNGNADPPAPFVITGPDQMSINQTATLSVSGGCGEPYMWSLSGGGSLSSSTGTSVNYTSPASNPNCDNNPIIGVTDAAGEKVYKQIAVNADSDLTKTAYTIYTVQGYYSPNYFWGWCFCNSLIRYFTAYSYNCLGSLIETAAGQICATCECGDAPYGQYSTAPTCSYYPAPGGPIDGRTDGDKAAGCCPPHALPPPPPPVTVPQCCDLAISNFQAVPSTIDINSGGTVNFSAAITSSGDPIIWTLTIAGRTFSGSGSFASANWDGRDDSGKIVAPGTYEATLLASTVSGRQCSAVRTITVTVIGCDLKIDSFSGSNTTLDRKGGSITFSASITSSKPFNYTLTINGTTFSFSGSADSSTTITHTFIVTDQFDKLVEPVTYTATLTAAPADSECPPASASTNVTISANDEDCSKLDVAIDSSLNVVSGNVNHTQTLFTVPNSKLMSDFTLTYNSRDGYSGVLGTGWMHNYNTILQYNSTQDTYVLSNGNGGRTSLYKNGNYYTSSISAYPILAKNSDNTLTLTYKNGAVYNFNAQGKLTSIADKNGNTLAFTYDSSSNLIKIADSSGKTITLGYDGNSRITSMTDPNNNTYSLNYGGNFLTSVSSNNSLGTQTWTYTYDDKGFMLTKTDPQGNLFQYAYDANHRVSQTIDPQGKIRSIQYDPDNAMTTVTQKDGGIWVYQYDTSLGVLTSKTDPASNAASFSYDTNRNLSSMVEFDSATGSNINTSYTYDSNGNVTSVNKCKIILGLLKPGGIVNVSYDDNKNLTYVAKAIQAQSLLNSGGIVKAFYVSNNSGCYTTHYTYNDQNLVTSITDPNGHVTQYGYDTNGNLTSVTDATNVVTTQYQYDTRGNISTITDALNNTTNMIYDQYNNLITVTDPKGGTVTMTYDSIGNMLSKTDALGNVTTYQYNSLNQMTQITDPLGKITHYTYDYNGNRLSATDANNNATQYVYDYKSHITQITDALNNITGMAYSGTSCTSCGSGVDKLTALTDAKSHTTIYEYDQVGNLIQETDPLGKITTYTYDSRGNVITRTNPDNITIFYRYDINNRLTQKTYSDNSVTAFQYDNAGNMTYAGNQNIAYQFTYDADNRITRTRITDSNGRTISYQYDAAGNRIAMIMPDNSTIAYTYDFNKLLTQITIDLGAFTFGYDANNRRTTRTLPNGTTAAYSYDQDSRLTGIQTTKGATTIDSVTYTYDNAGNRITKTQPQVNYNYNYDNIYRLTQATPSSGSQEIYTYDQVGNRLSKANDPSPTNNVNTVYSYDDENRLIGVQITQNSNVKQLSFTYDPFGRRISKTIIQDQIGTDCQSPNICPRTTNYVYDGQNIIMEYDQTGNITAKYTHGPNIDEPLAVQQGTNTYYYHADGLGSITALTNASGSIVQTYAYDSFGNMTATGSVSQLFTYTGREYDSETGMYFYRARYYDPKVGRFVTKDPIGFDGGDYNLYNYVGANPVSWVDPWGLASLITDRTAGTTTFDPRPEDPNGEPYTIETRNNVTRDSLPGSSDAFNTNDVTSVDNIRSPSYGPEGAYIDTGDPRGRDIHGGGSSLPDPYAPRQGWRPTKGCTRGQNEDIQELNRRINDFKKRHPKVKIPYRRK